MNKSKRGNRSPTRDVKTVVQRIFEQYPDPADLPSRGYNAHDRKAAHGAILAKLQRRLG